ncbi:MAG: hypothetical protein ACR65X_02775, partial [Methylocystis sp.]
PHRRQIRRVTLGFLLNGGHLGAIRSGPHPQLESRPISVATILKTSLSPQRYKKAPFGHAPSVYEREAMKKAGPGIPWPE